MDSGAAGFRGGDGGAGAVRVQRRDARRRGRTGSGGGISFLVGTVALLVAVLVAREEAPTLADLVGRRGGPGPEAFSGRST